MHPTLRRSYLGAFHLDNLVKNNLLELCDNPLYRRILLSLEMDIDIEPYEIDIYIDGQFQRYSYSELY
jgi:hypothetical protein